MRIFEKSFFNRALVKLPMTITHHISNLINAINLQECVSFATKLTKFIVQKASRVLLFTFKHR